MCSQVNSFREAHGRGKLHLFFGTHSILVLFLLLDIFFYDKTKICNNFSKTKCTCAFIESSSAFYVYYVLS